ncbi:MAG: radical SAM protein [Acidobacteriota bacterium]
MGTQRAGRSDRYPSTAAARDQFILDRRPPRSEHDPWRYQDLIVEHERAPDGAIARSATVFLTGRECPWRCVMCDLWRYTTSSDTPVGAIPAQLAAARRALAEGQTAPVRQMKLYNAGSFFDPRAVPESDYDGVVAHLSGLERVVVESHPALIGPRVERLLEALDRHRSPRDPAAAAPADNTAVRLEVAMGLETVHPEALGRLHKRMTVDQFAAAASLLGRYGVAVRAFLLIAPPFVPTDEQDAWLLQSIDVAVDCGASVVTLIPTRAGNGAMDALADDAFRPPRFDDIERSAALALARIRRDERIFVDVWDLEPFSACAACFPARRDRLHAMNLAQRVLAPIHCQHG